MINLLVMMGGKGGDLFPATKQTIQTNIINDYPQYTTSSFMATSADGSVVATSSSDGATIKIARFVSGAWTLEATVPITYPLYQGNVPLSFSADGTKLFALTSLEVLAIERSGSTWTKSIVVSGSNEGMQALSNRNGVAVFRNDGSGNFTLSIYTKPTSSWTVLQTLTVSGNFSSFTASDSGDHIAMSNNLGSSSKTFNTYKWNGSSYISNGNITASVPLGADGSHSLFTISDDGSTFVAQFGPLSGSPNAVIAKYSGGSWSVVSSNGLLIPRGESNYIRISTNGQFLVTYSSSGSFCYRLSPSGVFIAKYSLIPSAYSTYLIGPPSIDPAGANVYTPLTPYGTSPVNLFTSKR